jgi:Tfp pilus assembly protein PilF
MEDHYHRWAHRSPQQKLHERAVSKYVRLAAEYAETGDFAKASETLELAIEIQSNSEPSDYIDIKELRDRLKL